MASFTSGRDAALSRRRALSAGKAALPPAQERTRAGFRDARLPEAGAAQNAQGAAAMPAPIITTTAHAISGRTASMARRRMQASGKTALQTPAPSPQTQPDDAGAGDSLRRVAGATSQAGVRVTGSRTSRGQQVTGDERGTLLQVSGTPHIDAKSGAGHACGTKVGQTLTGAGLVVSGTMVRSGVRITGDERGDACTITGKADPRPSDDLTIRTPALAASASQFQRQVNPHGAGTAAGNLGRSARQVGSRQRATAPVIEATDAGTPITGSALGRSLRVTGDETGACRPISGSQYLAPARLETACGGTGGGTAPPAHLGAGRADPVTLSKVAVAATWGGQRVTGIDVEHHKRVTGDTPGTCAALTGSQYQGPATIDGYCGQDVAKSATARRLQARGRLPVTGDTPSRAQAVSGLDRGASRDITGTPYQHEDQNAVVSKDPVAALDAQFSIRSPQRAAQLCQVRQPGLPANAEAGRVTGAFAIGLGKVTGNLEFSLRARGQAASDKKPAHARLSGEGSSQGTAITGDSWAQQSRVTGTEGAFAAGRNPTERGKNVKPFAGATVFKAQATLDEPRQLVTGMSGSSAQTGARVTLSGGARS